MNNVLDFKGRPLKKGDNVILVPLRTKTFNAQGLFVDDPVRWRPILFGRVGRIDFYQRAGIYWMDGQKIRSLLAAHLLKVPSSCWFHEDNVKAFLKLEGLAERFGLKEE
ncbi:MAG TPA: hypothetical protein VGD26_04025 [Chitinophagaceae bacterium]